jgi:tRNA pseudouridine55 synthase
MKGIFALYKPKGPTSNDIVMKIKKITGEKKVGHAGTLDPLAEGVLVVGVGREATKKLFKEVRKEKEYEAVIKLGEVSTTGDQEGEKTKIDFNQKPSQEQIEKVLKKFIGEIEQVPPLFSAVKVNGKESYKRARKGEKFDLKSRRVFIKKIKLIDYNWPEIKIQTITGTGVYIRSLAEDIGESLKTGGYLKSLIRTRVGSYDISSSINIEDVKKLSLKS